MIRKLLPVLLLLVTFTFAAQAQKQTAAQKATIKADQITKFINSKITDKAQHITATQSGKIKDAFVEFYADKDALNIRKKKFGAAYKAFKAEAAKPVDKEGKAKLQEQKKELIVENKAINKETKEMQARREDKIKEVLNATQKVHFEAMRAEQAANRKEDQK